MSERDTSRSIDEKAADWIARLDRGPLTDEESQAFEAWLNGDPRRRGALLRADAVSMLSESARALGPQFEPRQFAVQAEPVVPAFSRRSLLGWVGAGGVAAASLVALGVGAPAAGAITTGLGEVRRVTLDDGSTVMLNTETRVEVRYSESERRVDLLEGEAYFTVVPDPRRPFLVESDGARLRAARAALRIRNLAGQPLDILVDEGRAALAVPGRSEPVLLKANMRYLLPMGGTTVSTMSPEGVSPDLVSRELAWREGKIAFEGERLDQAAAQFARYSRTRIEIEDPDLAREPVTGLFSASDPVGFGQAVADIFDAKVEHRGNVVVLSRRGARR
jgi:transmembrane sensor